MNLLDQVKRNGSAVLTDYVDPGRAWGGDTRVTRAGAEVISASWAFEVGKRGARFAGAGLLVVGQTLAVADAIATQLQRDAARFSGPVGTTRVGIRVGTNLVGAAGSTAVGGLVAYTLCAAMTDGACVIAGWVGAGLGGAAGLDVGNIGADVFFNWVDNGKVGLP